MKRGATFVLGVTLVIAFVAMLSGFISASSFTLGNISSSIEDSYAPGENVSGWINISLSNMPSDTIIRSNFGTGITLIDLLKNSSLDYSCSPSNCGNNYQATNGEDEKIFSMQAGDSKILSFMIQGDVDSVDGLSFLINSTADKSCNSPLKIDLSADDKVDWYSRKSTDDFSCNQDYGCFDSSADLKEYNIADKPYCEEINLSSAPAFQLGAWVQKGDGSYTAGMLKMQIYSINNQLLGDCNLLTPSDSGSEISCISNYSSNIAASYYVCIRGQAGMSNYKIRGENESSPCGFFNNFKGTYTNDYNIFAAGGRYDKVSGFVYNNSVFSQYSSNSLSSYLNSYISSKYNNNCSDGCTIPIEFTAGIDQVINLSNVNLQYTTTEGSLSSNQIYDAETTASNINSGFLLLDLGNAGFIAPSSYGSNNLNIYLGDDLIIKQNVTIIKKPIINSLTPLTTAAAVPTIFYASVSSPDNKSITKYSWDFGDGSTADTSVNTSSHTYNSTGLFSLKLTAFDSSGVSAEKIFSISVGSPEDLINATLEEKKIWLNNLTSQLNLMDNWEAQRIKDIINITNLQASLTSLQTQYLSASSESNFVSIMASLNSLQIPSGIERTNVNNIPLILLFKDIDNSKLKFLGAGDFQEGNYDDAIKSWFIDNMEGNISSKSVIFDYPSRQDVLLTFFTISLRQNKDVGEVYLVVDGNSNFKDTSISLNNAQGMKITGNKDLEFSQPGLVLAGDLSVYVAPKFSSLPSTSTGACNFNGVCETGENSANCRNDCKPYGTMIFWIIVVIILAGVGYFFMQRWYKDKYESELFPNKNDFNILINYVKNSLNEKNEAELRSELKKTGWTGEQVDYAIKKVEGKNTGLPMPEIKINKKDKAPAPSISLPLFPEKIDEKNKDSGQPSPANNNNSNQEGFRSGFKPFKT